MGVKSINRSLPSQQGIEKLAQGLSLGAEQVEALKAMAGEMGFAMIESYGEERVAARAQSALAAAKAGVPWEALITPRIKVKDRHSSRDEQARVDSISWEPCENPGYYDTQIDWALREALFGSAKSARAMLAAGCPSWQALSLMDQKKPRPRPSARAIVEWVLTWAFDTGAMVSERYGIKTPGVTVAAALVQRAAKEAPAEAADFAKLVLAWGKASREALWLNRDGCSAGEKEPAKKALWAQQLAGSIAKLEEVDPEWAALSGKVEAKAKSSGSGKAAVAAREAQKAPAEQSSRWHYLEPLLKRDDLEAWLALESLTGLGEALGLNQQLEGERQWLGSLWLSQALGAGAPKIAARMLERGANPWMLGQDLLRGGKGEDARSPLAGLAAARGIASKLAGAEGAALGAAFGAALLRDARLVEPEEERAKAITRQELDERLPKMAGGEGFRSGVEAWSLRAALGLAGLGGAQAEAAEPAPARKARRM